MRSCNSYMCMYLPSRSCIQSHACTQVQWNQLSDLHTKMEEGKSARQLLYAKLALGLLEDVPLGAFSIAWSIMSGRSLTEVQTLSFGQSMVMLGLKLSGFTTLPGLWGANKLLLARIESFKVDKKLGPDDAEMDKIERGTEDDTVTYC